MNVWTSGRGVGLGVYLFFNDTATTEIYTLSLHDALPIFSKRNAMIQTQKTSMNFLEGGFSYDKEMVQTERRIGCRSEEHTSELQSRQYLVCRLLLEKKKPLSRPSHQTPRLNSLPSPVSST